VASVVTPGTISGKIVLPAGMDGEDFDVDTYVYDEVDKRWELGKYTTANPDGTFANADLEDGLEYRLHLDSFSSTHLGGFYAGPGVALKAEPELGIPVYSPASGFELHPVKGIEISGSFALPDGFSWLDGGVLRGFEIRAIELRADEGDSVDSATIQVDADSDGRFTIT